MVRRPGAADHPRGSCIYKLAIYRRCNDLAPAAAKRTWRWHVTGPISFKHLGFRWTILGLPSSAKPVPSGPSQRFFHGRLPRPPLLPPLSNPLFSLPSPRRRPVQTSPLHLFSSRPPPPIHPDLYNSPAMATTAPVRKRPRTQSLPPLPTLTAEQAVAIAPEDHDSRRLIVVLSQACLETHKMSAGGPNGAEKYALLNSDDHIGVLKKMGRDISDAHPQRQQQP